MGDTEYDSGELHSVLAGAVTQGVGSVLYFCVSF